MPLKVQPGAHRGLHSNLALERVYQRARSAFRDHISNENDAVLAVGYQRNLAAYFTEVGNEQQTTEPKLRWVATKKMLNTIIIIAIATFEGTFAIYETFPVNVAKPFLPCMIDLIQAVFGRLFEILFLWSVTEDGKNMRFGWVWLIFGGITKVFLSFLSAVRVAWDTQPEESVRRAELQRLREAHQLSPNQTELVNYGKVTTPADYYGLYAEACISLLEFVLHAVNFPRMKSPVGESCPYPLGHPMRMAWITGRGEGGRRLTDEQMTRLSEAVHLGPIFRRDR
ncbi:hypothetical protein BJ508DRAFT_359503 [Ascobolus immersus RN42]|uniref:Uncharacterized protein n=1 Tax=Ascobolus immersus RN42 TaxID=1160509 RepID=A0A3N4IGP4_ASCIM|nr:hypothetical protein BJ508DRAFT_359503 [Ascobolus immersus RN42]